MNPRSFFLRPLMAVVACLLAAVSGPAAAQAAVGSTMVRLHTNMGPIDFNLLNEQAPGTVGNFLFYVRANDYVDSFIHRSAKIGGVPFVVQGGGYRWQPNVANCCSTVTRRNPITNEFNANRSNVRGTVAMAKLGGDPNSATSEWFINMGDNSGGQASLDTQNGGFTVFARVTAPGMVIADRIAALQVVLASNPGGTFSDLPLLRYTKDKRIERDDVVRVFEITEFPGLAQQTETDRILNYLEAAYPQYLMPQRGQANTAQGYSYRFYAGSNAYVGTKDGNVYYQVPALGSEIQLLGSVADLLAQAIAAGY